MDDTPGAPYIFAGSRDSARLALQDSLFGTYIRTNAQRLLGPQVTRILDLGCGNGLLGRVFLELYPQATLIGIDRDPQAIERARQAQIAGVRQVSYVVGDIEAELPPGPFDLIYASVVLAHTRQPDRVLHLVRQRLRPGGIVWIKDLVFRSTIKFSPAFQRLAGLLADSIARLGGQPEVVAQLPALLAAGGFTAIRQEQEEYPLGGPTPGGQLTLAICLTAFQNAQPMILRTHAITADELNALYLAAKDEAQARDAGVLPGVNILAQRP